MSTETSLVAYFADLEDPRIERNRKHPLMNILTIAILGVLCGADTWVDIQRYGQAKRDWLANFLDLSNGIPSHDTFGRVFRCLDAEQFQAQFVAWTQHICQATGGQAVALDGKKLRRSQDRQHQRDGIWMVSAWASENRLVLGQRRLDDKSNEITVVPELLAVLDIAFREDESRIRKDHAPQNMAILRQMALNLLKQETSVKVGVAAKRKMAGWDNDYLRKVLYA